jgi:hypothetical protein
MRVLNLSTMDLANLSHQNAKSLRAVGVDCADWTFQPHAFDYQTQSKQTTLNHIAKHYKDYDCVQVFHSDPRIFQVVKDHPKLIIHHTGSRYRNNKAFYDSLFKGQRIFTNHCEFLLHNKDFTYIAPHFNYIQEKPKAFDGTITIGHFPSNPIVKGTDKIKQMIKPFEEKFNFIIDETRYPHYNNLQRISKCDIYIELFKPFLNGNLYGHFGVTAFEATALGCLVITNNSNAEAYEKVYGNHNFFLANNEEKFHNILNWITKDNFETIRSSMHHGFIEKHNIQASGKHLLNLLK